MRATERQRRSGQNRPAWPGNAGDTVTRTARRSGERRSASGGAARIGLRGRGTLKTRSREQHLSTSGAVEQLRCDLATNGDRVGATLAGAQDDPSVERSEESFDLDVRRLLLVDACECS